jgi:hypothetical protein
LNYYQTLLNRLLQKIGKQYHKLKKNSLAETGVHVALQIASLDSIDVAVAHFAPEDGVEAKCLWHALVALFSSHLRRTNAGTWSGQIFLV